MGNRSVYSADITLPFILILLKVGKIYTAYYISAYILLAGMYVMVVGGYFIQTGDLPMIKVRKNFVLLVVIFCFVAISLP